MPVAPEIIEDYRNLNTALDRMVAGHNSRLVADLTALSDGKIQVCIELAKASEPHLVEAARLGDAAGAQVMVANLIAHMQAALSKRGRRLS